MNITTCIDCGRFVSMKETVEVDLIRVGSGHLCERCQDDHDGESSDQMAAVIWEQMETERIAYKERKTKRLIAHGGKVESTADLIKHRNEVFNHIIYGGTSSDQRKRLFKYIGGLKPVIQIKKRRQL